MPSRWIEKLITVSKIGVKADDSINLKIILSSTQQSQWLSAKKDICDNADPQGSTTYNGLMFYRKMVRPLVWVIDNQALSQQFDGGKRRWFANQDIPPSRVVGTGG